MKLEDLKKDDIFFCKGDISSETAKYLKVEGKGNNRGYVQCYNHVAEKSFELSGTTEIGKAWTPIKESK